MQNFVTYIILSCIEQFFKVFQSLHIFASLFLIPFFKMFNIYIILSYIEQFYKNFLCTDDSDLLIEAAHPAKTAQYWSTHRKPEEFTFQPPRVYKPIHQNSRCFLSAHAWRSNASSPLFLLVVLKSLLNFDSPTMVEYVNRLVVDVRFANTNFYPPTQGVWSFTTIWYGLSICTRYVQSTLLHCSNL